MTYHRQKAIEYARQWAYGRNPEYYNFDPVGGDCTSFISQCLYAGCHVMNYTRDVGWYYKSSYDRAAAWSGVEYLYRFLTRNKGTGPYAEETPLAQVQPGDIIQLNFTGTVYGHSLLVVKVDEASENGIYIATHTDDSYERLLSTYTYHTARLLHIEGVRR